MGDGDPAVRRGAAWALKALGQPQWCQWVGGDACDFQRLGDSGDARAIEPLLKAFGDGDSKIRKSAVESVAGIHEPRTIEALIRALNDEKADVMQAACAVLKEIGDEETVERAIEALIQNIESPNLSLYRKEAAVKELIGWSKPAPTSLVTQWPQIRHLAKEHLHEDGDRHTDHKDDGGGCGPLDHTDGPAHSDTNYPIPENIHGTDF